jgi:undecaprenyl-diphosphatase
MDWFYYLDVNTLFYIQDFLRTSGLTFFFEEITDLGNSGLIWIILGLALLTVKRTRVPGLLVLAAVIASGAIDNMVIKTVVDRTRPFLAVPGIHNLITAHGSSFPSGHTGTSFAAAGVLWQTLPRLYGAGALALAALIGLSRLYLGVHYPSDVLGGMLIGLTIAGTIVWLYQRSREKISV